MEDLISAANPFTADNPFDPTNRADRQQMRDFRRAQHPHFMPGTVDPNMQAPMPGQDALVQALRGFGGGGGAPAQYGNVQSAGYIGQGMNADAIGKALGQGVSGLGNMFNNIGTAQQYGTNPFSQQTNMLAAQNAGF